MDSMSGQNTSGQMGQGQGQWSGSEAEQQALNPNAMNLDANDPNVARDPVCGQLVDKRTAPDTLASPVNDPEGTVYFHSAECKSLYEEDPSRYGSNF